MMRIALIGLVGLLTACTAVITQQVNTVNTVRKLALKIPPPPPVIVEEEGSEFFAKYSTTSALNSRRAFVSDYHGEVRMTLYPNRRVDCRWWAEGRVTDPSLYEGPNGFLKAFSTLCKGKLQRDGTFEFQGAYSSAEQESPTFTIRGTAVRDTITGEIVIGELFRTDNGTGVRFEAIALEKSPDL